MNTVNYRVRLVLEACYWPSEGGAEETRPVREAQLFDPHPSLELATQEFDDVVHTLDEKRRVDGLREGEY